MQKQTTLKLAEDQVKPLEELRLTPYLDGAGNPSIGFGATTIDGRKVTMRDKCTEQQALMWLQNRIEEDFNKLEFFCNMHDINLEDNQAAAILSFTYNAGFNSFLNSSMARDLITKKTDKVALDLIKWNKIRVDGKLTFSRGLFNRRMEESQCFVNRENCR